MINEHIELVKRIKKLDEFVHGDASKDINRIEFANCCIQLKAMCVYAEALKARLYNANIEYDHETNEYKEYIGKINFKEEDTPDEK